MQFPPFGLERYLDRYEFKAPYLLCCSDCESLSVGNLLAREPEEITIGDIIRALEGPVALSECVGEGLGDCEYESECAIQIIWEQVKEEIDGVLDSITLQDLRQEAINARQKGQEHGYMYHI